jgi:hypothetical protein
VRWNRLHFILERFDKIKNCILKSLINLGSSISFDEEVATLKPVSLAVMKALFRRDATLMSTDTVK